MLDLLVSHEAQSFNIRPNWRDSSNTSLLVCRSTDRCCPQSPSFHSTSIVSSPLVSIFTHTSPWLVVFAWLVWLHQTNENTSPRSLKAFLGCQMFGCVPPTKPSVSSVHPNNPAMWRYHVVGATHSTWYPCKDQPSPATCFESDPFRQDCMRRLLTSTLSGCLHSA